MLSFLIPGKMTDNSSVESFNFSFLYGYLNVHWFLLLADAQEKVGYCRKEYDSLQPHSSLQNLTLDEAVTAVPNIEL